MLASCFRGKAGGRGSVSKESLLENVNEKRGGPSYHPPLCLAEHRVDLVVGRW
jgi:hypothetical protein